MYKTGDELQEVMEQMMGKREEKEEFQGNVKMNGKREQRQNKVTAGNFIVSNAIDYMNAHYTEKLSLTGLADKIYVSQWHLSKQLHKCTGQSFHELLNQIRIERAKKLMQDPALKIHEIAEIVGFCDAAHFSRVFKKTEYISPKEYRNRCL